MLISKKFDLNFLLLLFLFYASILLPKLYMREKFIITFICLLLSFFYMMKTPNINKYILVWFLAYTAYFFIWFVIGILNNNNFQGLIDNFKLNCIYTFVFFFFLFTLSKNDNFKIIFKSIIISNFIISLYIFIIYFNAIGLVNLDFINKYTYNITGVLNKGYTKIASPIVFSLIYTAPFTLVYYFQSKVKKSIFSLLNVLFSFVAIIIAGNRIVLLLFCTILCVCILNSKPNKKKLIVFSFFLIFLILSFLILLQKGTNINVNTIISRILNEIRISEENVRWQQISELYKGFLDNPIIGTGFAKGVSSIIRNEQNWLYEVVYFLYLYNTGIIGTIIYFLLLLTPIIMGIKFKHTHIYDLNITPAITGYICVLLGCWTNPILSKFDSLWFLFLLPMYLNSKKTGTKNESK